MDNEIWKPIANHELDYEVSSHGRVRRISSDGHNGKPGRILSQYASRSGYLNATLCTGGKLTRYRTHVLVARAFIPNTEGKPQVNHRDGVKAHNHYGNLEWVTASENQQHAVAAGLHMRLPGESNPQAKLTAEQVSQIRARRASGESVKAISKDFPVHEMHIYRILQGKRW